MSTSSHGRGRTHLKADEQKHRRDKSSSRTGYKGGDRQVVTGKYFISISIQYCWSEGGYLAEILDVQEEILLDTFLIEGM